MNHLPHEPRLSGAGMTKIPISAIIRATTRFTGTSESELTGNCKQRDLCAARWIVMIIARNEGHSLTQIGRVLGKDHSTISYGCERAIVLAERLPEYWRKIDDVRRLARQLIDRERVKIAISFGCFAA